MCTRTHTHIHTQHSCSHSLSLTHICIHACILHVYIRRDDVYVQVFLCMQASHVYMHVHMYTYVVMMHCTSISMFTCMCTYVVMMHVYLLDACIHACIVLSLTLSPASARQTHFSLYNTLLSLQHTFLFTTHCSLYNTLFSLQHTVLFTTHFYLVNTHIHFCSSYPHALFFPMPFLGGG